jgi:LysR family transcriptional regulator, glycine cleavage system transcriptional activator
MVHLLEDRLGVALFERKANRLAVTGAGRTYQTGLTTILDALASLTEQVTAQAGARVLTIGVGPTFAIRWLIPRLADFRRRQPDIEVRFATGGAAAPFGDDWTCGITLGNGDWPGLVSERLFAADLVPVCTPRLAARLKRPGDLKGPQLLRVAHARGDWPRWLAAAGAGRDLKIAAKGPEFEFYGQALQAAADGVGVAMGLRPYIDDDVAAGRLATPFALTVPKGQQWYLVCREERRAQRDFVAFRQWLMRAARPAGNATDAKPVIASRRRSNPDFT